MVLLAALMIFLPLSCAGDPNEPAPPTAIMYEHCGFLVGVQDFALEPYEPSCP